MSEADVRSAFRAQAGVCANLGSPFTAKICELIAERLEASSGVGAQVLGWLGDPQANADGLPLRLCGALHAIARRGWIKAVTAAWPPNPTPDDEALWAAISAAFDDQSAFILDWLNSPPQTNEVGRSAPLMVGLLVLAERFGLPFELYELGSSAGLNLNLDRYAFDIGGIVTGDPASTVCLAPAWTGEPPPDAEVSVALRRGVDLNPLDPTDPATAERLTAFVWADQRERLDRLEAALTIAQRQPPRLDQADGASWLERVLDVTPRRGVCRVVMHTIALQYFSPADQRRVKSHLDHVGASATDEAPVAWLAYEGGGPPDRDGRRWAELRLTIWPGGETRLLARGHPHGFSLEGFLQTDRGGDRP